MASIIILDWGRYTVAHHQIPTGEEYITLLTRWDVFTNMIGVSVAQLGLATFNKLRITRDVLL